MTENGFPVNKRFVCPVCFNEQDEDSGIFDPCVHEKVICALCYLALSFGASPEEIKKLVGR